MKRWIRRTAIAGTAIVLVGALAGAGYETTARRNARRDFPVSGRLVDIGDGRRLQLDCRGAGEPTIVLESGLDAYGAMAWSAVHDSLAATTRTCAYSRAGILWSDPAPGSFDSRRAAEDLHAALTQAGEHAPWVMVGHSLGGPYLLTFTGRYPNEVAGVALVDASHPDQLARLPAPAAPLRALMWSLPRLGPGVTGTGLVRLLPNDGLPQWTSNNRAAFRALAPSSYSAMLREMAQTEASLRAAAPVTSLGDRPLVVMTGERPTHGTPSASEARWTAAWKSLQVDETHWSTRARHVEVAGASHYIHTERPDVVITEVRRVVSDVRGLRLANATVSHPAGMRAVQ